MMANESARDIKHKNIASNFDLGECFCDIRCRHGHETRLFNIGRGHFIACDTCRTFVCIGANLMSSWRLETKGHWENNCRSIEWYEEIEMPF